MSSGQDSKPFQIPPTSGQIKTALWLGVIASAAFWCIFVYIVQDRTLTNPWLALPLPIFATAGTIFTYFKHRSTRQREG